MWLSEKYLLIVKCFLVLSVSFELTTQPKDARKIVFLKYNWATYIYSYSNCVDLRLSIFICDLQSLSVVNKLSMLFRRVLLVTSIKNMGYSNICINCSQIKNGDLPKFFHLIKDFPFCISLEYIILVVLLFFLQSPISKETIK